MIWDRLDEAWMSAHRDLCAFCGQHGHFEVPLDYRTADGIRLAEWQGTQRDADRAGKLTGQRKALLDEIGFPWDPAGARWMRRYRQLTDALARHGGPRDLPAGSRRPPGWKASTSPTTAGNSLRTRSPCWSRQVSRSAARINTMAGWVPGPAGVQGRPRPPAGP